MDPRISFSSDFVDIQKATKQHESSYREAPVSSDFEFSVQNYTMIPADEIFCKGMVMPSRGNYTNQLRKMTLREELLVDDSEYKDGFQRVPKSSGRWRDRFGLKKISHVVHKRSDRVDNGVWNREVEEKKPVCVHQIQDGVTSKRIVQ